MYKGFWDGYMSIGHAIACTKPNTDSVNLKTIAEATAFVCFVYFVVEFFLVGIL